MDRYEYSPTLAFDKLPGVLIKCTCKNAPPTLAFDKLRPRGPR